MCVRVHACEERVRESKEKKLDDCLPFVSGAHCYKRTGAYMICVQACERK